MSSFIFYQQVLIRKCSTMTKELLSQGINPSKGRRRSNTVGPVLVYALSLQSSAMSNAHYCPRKNHVCVGVDHIVRGECQGQINSSVREVHFLPPPLTLGGAPQRASGRDDIPKVAKRLPLNYMPVSGRLAALCYIHFYIFRSIHRHVVLMRAFT